MALKNYFYDTRSGTVYTAQELKNLDKSDLKFIEMVPSDGNIINGKYVKFNSERKRTFSEDVDMAIDMVNRHHEEKRKAYGIPLQAEGNYSDMSLYVYNIVAEVEKGIDDFMRYRDSSKYFNTSADDVRSETIKQIKEKLVNDDQYTYLSEKDVERAFEKGKHSGPVRAEYKKEQRKRTAVAIMVAILLLVSINLGFILKDKISDAIDVNQSNIAIAQLSYDENDTKYYTDAYNDPKKYVDIVGQNTRRTKNLQNYYFKNREIAEDILKLPYYAIDMGIYNVYLSMGADRYNPGHPNLDEVIDFLGQLTQGDEVLKKKFGGCYTFDDYLIKNGFYSTNEQGEKTADVQKWIEYQRQSLINYKDKLQSDAADHVENLFLGVGK